MPLGVARVDGGTSLEQRGWLVAWPDAVRTFVRYVFTLALLCMTDPRTFHHEHRRPVQATQQDAPTT